MWLVEFASAVSGLLAALAAPAAPPAALMLLLLLPAPHYIACSLRASIPVYTSYYTLGQRATHPLQQHGILSWDLAPLWSVLVPPAPPWSRCARARGCSATEHSLLAALSQCRHLGSVLSGATALTTWSVVGRALTTAVLQADDLQPSVRRVADAGERHQLVQADV
jgi:hypothetical protein